MKVVLFHKNCNDGLFAAYAAWQKFGADALYIPVTYKPIQDLTAEAALEYIFSAHTGKHVDPIGNSRFKVTDVTKDKYQDIDLYVVDYSFPVHHFLEHCAVFNSVTVLDHHKAAIEDYCEVFPQTTINEHWTRLKPFDNAELTFSKKESGAKLVWMYFNPGEEVPGVFDLVSDRDLWKFQLQYTRPFHAGIRGLNEQNFERLDKLVKFEMARVLDLGIHFERQTTDRIKSVMRANTRTIFVYIDGKEYTGAVINTFADIASDLCAAVIKEQGCDIAIAFNIHADTNVQCSIRSTNQTALKVARALGGAGHDDASGFHLTLEALTNILTKGILEV